MLLHGKLVRRSSAHILRYDLFQKAKGRYVADVDENRPPFSPASPEANAPFASSIIGNNGLSLVKPGLIVLPGTTTLARTREAARRPGYWLRS